MASCETDSPEASVAVTVRVTDPSSWASGVMASPDWDIDTTAASDDLAE